MASDEARPHPAKRAGDLQRRVRGLTALLKRGEPYHVELDAIASELGILSMDLESYDPSCHAYRTPRMATNKPLKETVEFGKRGRRNTQAQRAADRHFRTNV